MRNFLRHLPTTSRIAYTFSLFNFVSMFALLLIINITYFFIWYSEQKEASLHDMDMKYSLFSMPNSDMEVEEFTSYLLEKDTLIIPPHGETICSPSLEKKIHSDIEMIQKSYFYKYDGKIYFIFSQYYEKIGYVKVLFDTTPYINSQLIIIQTSIAIIFLFSFLNFFVGKIISRKALLSLTKMTQEVSQIDIESVKKVSIPHSVDTDEIRVLAESMNKMIEKIQKQTSDLKQFITDVSHEFKTPLMAMNSYLDLQIKKSETGKNLSHEIPEFIDYLKGNIKKLNRLLETLFYLARLEEGIVKIDTKKIDALQFFEQKIQEISLSFPTRKIQVSLDKKKHIYYTLQENLLSIVVENLLTNACKFAGVNEKVDIRLFSDRFEIQDYGLGISEKDIAHIWQKFYKTDTKKEGFGVGLFLVKRICEVNGWKIEVQSTIGKGSTFIIYL